MTQWLTHVMPQEVKCKHNKNHLQEEEIERQILSPFSVQPPGNAVTHTHPKSAALQW